MFEFSLSALTAEAETLWKRCGRIEKPGRGKRRGRRGIKKGWRVRGGGGGERRLEWNEETGAAEGGGSSRQLESRVSPRQAWSTREACRERDDTVRGCCAVS